MDFLGFSITRDAQYRARDAQMALAAALGEDDPRKVNTGSPYDSKGTVPVDPTAYREMGSAGGGVIRDIVPKLSSRGQATRVYEEMTNSDATVDVSLRAAKVPVMSGKYFIEPYDDNQDNMDIAEFCEFNLLKGQSQPFLLVLEDILRMYEYGFSVVEPCWELREWAPKRTMANRRNYTMLKKLAPRPTPTISEIRYDDNGGPVSILQKALRTEGKTEDVEIPISKLIIFTWGKRGGNLEGKSLLRTAYKHWFYVDVLEKIDAIQKERHGIGVPKAKLAPNYNTEDKKLAWELVQALRTNEKAGMVLPPGFDIEFAKVEGQLVNVMASIEHHRSMIMLNVMVQFLLLGIQAGGGRATSASHQNMFEKSLKYVANLVCDYVNLFLIPKLVGYNFNTDKFPKLNVRNIGEGKEMQSWASALSNLAAQNLVTLDIETEQWVREQIDMPFKLGGKQTPEANSSSGNDFNKGGVQTEGNTDQSGNIGKQVDEP